MIQTAYAGIIAAVPAFLSPVGRRGGFLSGSQAGLLGPISAGLLPAVRRAKCYEFIKSFPYPRKKVKKPVFSSYLRNEGVRKTQKQGLIHIGGTEPRPRIGRMEKNFQKVLENRKNRG